MAIYIKTTKTNLLFSGFSLVELIISMCMLSILTSIAIPSFQKLKAKNQLRGTQILLHNALSLARQTAITSGNSTYICELVDNNKCSAKHPFNADWGKGWIVFTDKNNNGNLDNEDHTILIHYQKAPIGIIFNQQGRIRFRKNGSARSAGFYLCNKIDAIHILILYSGRTRIQKLTKNDRINKCRMTLK